VESPLKGKRILDVGCGAGIVSMALCRLGATVVGLDATEKAIETGQKMKTTLPPELHSNIDFTFATVEQFVTHPENIQSKL
jgi:2-polyprenyl-6-hydroxyphenyl methylase/3-demethylubiquinone-9 3-methyltransferase